MIVQHYKGGVYEILIERTVRLTDGIIIKGLPDIEAKHTETSQKVFVWRNVNHYLTHFDNFVIYKGLEHDSTIWARPYDMFWGLYRGEDNLEFPRFTIIEE